MEASESRLSGMGAEGLDQADSEQTDVAKKTGGCGLGFTIGRE